MVTESRSDIETTVLLERLKVLLTQDWCKTLISIEDADPEKVDEYCKDIVRAAPAASGVRGSARTLNEKKEEVRLYCQPSKLAIASVAGIVLFCSVLAWLVVEFLYGGPTFAALAAGWGLLVTAWIPLSLQARMRKRLGIKKAPAQLSIATTDLDRRLRSLVGQGVRRAVDVNICDPQVEFVQVEEASHLSSRAQKDQRIGTPSRLSIEHHLLRAGGATVGITGERGVGKSEILRSFSDDLTAQATVKEGGTIGVLVSTPAAFDGIQFLKVAIRRLAESVPGSEEVQKRERRSRSVALGFVGLIGFALVGLGYYAIQEGLSFEDVRVILGSLSPIKWQWAPIHLYAALILLGFVLYTSALTLNFRHQDRDVTARSTSSPTASKTLDEATLKRARIAVAVHASRVLERLRYTEAIAETREGTATLGKVVGLKRSRQRSLTALSSTENDLIDEFEVLSGKLEAVGYRIFICIDEMDKLEEGKPTENFLNSIKQLFVVRSVSFVVSISSSAWSQFARRGVQLRDALDSSLDAIETVDPMDFLETRSLLRHRGEDITDMQSLLCYVLAGGLPREVLRAARSMAQVNHDLGGNTKLTTVASELIAREAAALLRASIYQATHWETESGKAAVRDLRDLVNDWKIETLQRKVCTDSVVEEELTRIKGWLQFFLVVEQLFVTSPEVFDGPTNEVLDKIDLLAKARRELEFSFVIARATLDLFQASPCATAPDKIEHAFSK